MFSPQVDISDRTINYKISNKFQASRNQEDDSNNQRILSIISDNFNEIKNKLLDMYQLTLLDNATGQILTDWATDYGITRIDNDDDFLRFEVKWQILKSQTPTTMNGLKTLISVLLNIEPSIFDILPTENPEEIEIVNIPFDFNSGSHSDLKRKILSQSIQSVLPVEYKLKDIQYSKNAKGQLYFAFRKSKAVIHDLKGFLNWNSNYKYAFRITKTKSKQERGFLKYGNL